MLIGVRANFLLHLNLSKQRDINNMMTKRLTLDYKRIFICFIVLFLSLFSLSACVSSSSVSARTAYYRFGNYSQYNRLFVECGDDDSKLSCKEVKKIIDKKSDKFIEYKGLNEFNSYLKPLEEFTLDEISNMDSLDSYFESGTVHNTPLSYLYSIKISLIKHLKKFVYTPDRETVNLFFRNEKNLCDILNDAETCKLVALKYLVKLNDLKSKEEKDEGGYTSIFTLIYKNELYSDKCMDQFEPERKIVYEKQSMLDRIKNYIIYSEKACNLGDLYSCNEIARDYRKGIFVKKDYHKAFALLKKGFEIQASYLKKGYSPKKYCLFNGVSNDDNEEKIYSVGSWKPNIFTSLLSLSLDKNTPKDLIPNVKTLLNKYSKIENCKSFPIPKHSYYYADEFVPTQKKILEKLAHKYYLQRCEREKEEQLYYKEQLKKMESMPEYLEINGRPCYKDGLGYNCD